MLTAAILIVIVHHSQQTHLLGKSAAHYVSDNGPAPSRPRLLLFFTELFR